MKQLCATILLIILLSATASALAESTPDPLEFRYIQLPPFGYTDSEGNARGHLARVAKRVLESMDQPVRFRQHPAPRLYRQLKSGRTDMALGPKGLHQLRESALESEEAVLTLTLSIYHRVGTRPVFSVEDLNGKRIVLMQGYSYGKTGRLFETFNNRTEINYARTHRSALKMLLFNRAEYLLNYQIPSETVIAKEALAGLKGQVVDRTPIHFFVSKKTPGARRLVEKWDHHLRELEANGDLSTLRYYQELN